MLEGCNFVGSLAAILKRDGATAPTPSPLQSAQHDETKDSTAPQQGLLMPTHADSTTA
jgi:hypothetical protein